jgi:hypothetical protein
LRQLGKLLGPGHRHAHRLVELTDHRYEEKCPLITNRAFADWSEDFPNVACLVSRIRRITDNVEVIAGDVRPTGSMSPSSAPSSAPKGRRKKRK